MLNLFRAFTQKLLGATVFYTQIPLPASLPFDFNGIARFSPIVGLLIGGILGEFMHLVFSLPSWKIFLLFSSNVLSAIVIGLWIWITGGMHLDGAMDTADGLAVPDRTRRLEAMRDSQSGAFGVMAAIVIVLLKFTALNGLLNEGLSSLEMTFLLMLTCAWARWAQMQAIARYPYLRDRNGKGYLHQNAVTSFWDAVPSGLVILGVSGIGIELGAITGELCLILPIATLFLSWGLSHWIARQLGGHTGDTYGAIVEWVEAILLVLISGM